jgi:hypothetical protein
MMKFTLKALLLAAASYTASAALGDDYITEVPPTVYEADEISPQNADYDKDNMMFIAHPGWLNNKVRWFLSDQSPFTRPSPLTLTVLYLPSVRRRSITTR